MRHLTKILVAVGLMFVLFPASQTNIQASLKLSDIHVIRHLPEKYSGGETIVVSLDIKPFLPTEGKIIEKVPDGWKLVAATPPFIDRPFRNMYVWKTSDTCEIITSIKYTLEIPKGNRSRKEFTGYIDIGNIRLTIVGDRHIWGE
ncbi:MAG TPA: hypothetical protein PKX05_03015 [bacterium]|nr:hypothetical protein [bacterium]